MHDRLFDRAGPAEELIDGYQFRFPGEAEIIAQLTDFIQFERECCPFLTFELLFKPEQGPVTLRLRGPEGTKAFLEAMMD